MNWFGSKRVVGNMDRVEITRLRNKGIKIGWWLYILLLVVATKVTAVMEVAEVEDAVAEYAAMPRWCSQLDDRI